MYTQFCKMIQINNSTKYVGRFFWCLVVVLITNGFEYKSLAIQYPDGKLAFESAVLLTDTYATFNRVRARQAKYYFDLELPNNVGEYLGKVVIKQRVGGDEIKFEPDKTKAYLGTHNNKQEELDLTTFYSEDTGEIIVLFDDRSIPPGSKVTIGLKPKRNPDLGGVYLFGVTAFPPGERSLGLYLGAGRLHFYQSDYFDFH